MGNSPPLPSPHTISPCSTPAKPWRWPSTPTLAVSALTVAVPPRRGRVDAAAKLPGQGTGQSYLVREREVAAVQCEPSLIPTAQLPEDRILELAGPHDGPVVRGRARITWSIHKPEAQAKGRDFLGHSTSLKRKRRAAIPSLALQACGVTADPPQS